MISYFIVGCLAFTIAEIEADKDMCRVLYSEVETVAYHRYMVN